MSKKITITDIAKKSGVSVTTVSRVLNNSPSVSPAKRERILRIIDEYNYTPSIFARGMINHKTKNIGVMLPDITNPYFASFFLQVEHFALSNMYATILFNTMYTKNHQKYETPLSEADYFKIILEKQVDGVLILGGQIDKEEISPAFIEAINELHRNVPVVVVGSKIEGCNCLFIERNSKQGITSLVHHFKALGHSNIGFIGGEPGIRITTARINAFRQCMRTFGKEPLESHIVMSDYYAPDGYQAMKQLLDDNNNQLPTAIIAINDMVALGAIRAMKDANLSCPEDIAIASCDQFLHSDYFTPRLTTVDQHNEYLGRMAVMQLISAINGSIESISVEHMPQLVIRESCGSITRS
ncbi:LacI family DNA-binding transcriptional regulator [Paenibacillus sp. N3.4]|uniref:LacI family DNA-binding transcriptional regulator n=1 Tax=Paenibacillus sp. N3.4 TaxID=2603222 RepID=UPI0011CB70E7|nr:LacI family DNA-binding transcriptional regulator [Paenibacillus sp. N3.4]TXK84609.1 LacI family transcriptional regulator [Paenibacillus sp. N3.4]